MQAVVESAEFIDVAIDRMATFDSVTGGLVLPELEIDGEVAGRNLVFSLVDAGQLIFRLDSLD